MIVASNSDCLSLYESEPESKASHDHCYVVYFDNDFLLLLTYWLEFEGVQILTEKIAIHNIMSIALDAIQVHKICFAFCQSWIGYFMCRRSLVVRFPQFLIEFVTYT